MQNFRAVPGVPMEHAPEPDDDEVTLAVAMARLILDPDVSLQAPPNLNPAAAEALLASGLNDFGGISPVTPGLHQPAPPLAAPRRARRGLRARGLHAASARLASTTASSSAPGFLDPALLGADARGAGAARGSGGGS